MNSIITKDPTITDEQRTEMRRQRVATIFKEMDKRTIEAPKKRPCYCDYTFHPEGC